MSLATSDVEFLKCLVAKHSGNVISQRQVPMLEQRLTPLAETLGLKDTEHLVAELRCHGGPSLSKQVAEAVTVNETSFFRDVHVFEALRNKIIPELVESNASTKRIRIWCAACSSGQEPHSLAMVIREHFPHLSDWDIKIVATDLSTKMLDKSRSGEYSQLEVNRGLPLKSVVRFFDKQGPNWRAKPELRDMIEHRQLNLTQPWLGLGEFDIVLIRNVLIYFDHETKADILQRIRRSLRPNGHMFIGSAELLIGAGVPFKREQIDATVCYRPISA